MGGSHAVLQQRRAAPRPQSLHCAGVGGLGIPANAAVAVRAAESECRKNRSHSPAAATRVDQRLPTHHSSFSVRIVLSTKVFSCSIFSKLTPQRVQVATHCDFTAPTTRPRLLVRTAEQNLMLPELHPRTPTSPAGSVPVTTRTSFDRHVHFASSVLTIPACTRRTLVSDALVRKPRALFTNPIHASR